MFSSMLQNLLSSSGQSTAMQRAVQMNAYVNKYNDQWVGINKADNEQLQPKEVQTFDSVLKNSATVKFGDLLTKPNTKVNAEIYTAFQAPKLHSGCNECS